MLTRVPQRAVDDCSICVVAMVMGLPFTYERVRADSLRYEKVTLRGTFPAWWETYLRDEGFNIGYRVGLPLIKAFAGRLVGILTIAIPSHAAGHVVAMDEIGVLDPATGMPDHMPLQEFISLRRRAGHVVDPVWLGILK